MFDQEFNMDDFIANRRWDPKLWYEKLCRDFFLADYPNAQLVDIDDTFPGIEGIYFDTDSDTYIWFQSKESKRWTPDLFRDSAKKLTLVNLRSHTPLWQDEIVFSKITYFWSRNVQPTQDLKNELKTLASTDWPSVEEVDIIWDAKLFEYINLDHNKYSKLISKFLVRTPWWLEHPQRVLSEILFMNEYIDVQTKILELESFKQSDHPILRVLWISWFWKTRFILEAYKEFDWRVLYWKITEQNKWEILRYISKWFCGTLILDDCDTATFQSLKNSQRDNGLKLICIWRDHNERIQSYEANKMIFSTNDAKEITSWILWHLKSTERLDDQTSKIIENLSWWFPLMAYHIIRVLENEVEINEKMVRELLNTDLLLHRILQKQIDSTEWRVYSLWCLWSSLRIEELIFAYTEFYWTEISETQVKNSLHYFIQLWLCDERWRYYVIKPVPVRRNRLVRMFEDFGDFVVKVQNIITYASTLQDQARSFDERYAEVYSQAAPWSEWSDFVDDILRQSFSSAEYFHSTVGSLVLSHLVEVNPEKIISYLYESYSIMSDEDIKGLSNTKSYILHTIQKALYREWLYKKCMDLLYLLAKNETQVYANNAVATWRETARISLSGVAENLDSRLEYCKQMISKDFELWLELISWWMEWGHMVKFWDRTYQWWMSYKEYKPKLRSEVHSYLKSLFEILSDQYYEKDIEWKKKISKLVTERLLWLIQHWYFPKELLIWMIKEWSLDRSELISRLNRARNRSPKKAQEMFDEVISSIVPDDLQSRIQLHVKDWIIVWVDDVNWEEYKKKSEEIINNIVDEILEKEVDIFEFDIELFQWEVRYGVLLWEFLWTKLSDNWFTLANEIIDFLEDKESFNYGVLLWIVKELPNINQARELIQRCMDSGNEQLKWNAFHLTSYVAFDLSDLLKLSELWDEFINWYRIFVYWKVLEKLPDNDLYLLLTRLASYWWTLSSIIWINLMKMSWGRKVLWDNDFTKLLIKFVTDWLPQYSVHNKLDNLDLYHRANLVKALIEYKYLEHTTIVKLSQDIKEFYAERNSDTYNNNVKDVMDALLELDFETTRRVLTEDMSKEWGIVYVDFLYILRQGWLGKHFESKQNIEIILRQIRERERDHWYILSIVNSLPLTNSEWWNELAMSIIQEFSEIDWVLWCMWANIWTKSWTWSQIWVIDADIDLYDSLAGIKIPAVQKRRKENLNYLKKNKERVEIKEAEEYL